jgi:hypothetical protein
MDGIEIEAPVVAQGVHLRVMNPAYLITRNEIRETA